MLWVPVFFVVQSISFNVDSSEHKFNTLSSYALIFIVSRWLSLATWTGFLPHIWH